MEECRIINYSGEWRDRLRVYMRKRFVKYSDSYIDYCLDHSEGQTPAKLVINENGAVVGCQLYYCTKAIIHDRVVEIQWGHDMFLDEEYRATIGLDFMFSVSANGGFGLGLTNVSEKIHKQLKYKFIHGVYNYYIVNRLLFLLPFQKLFKLKPAITNNEIIKVGDLVFRRIYSVNELSIPNNGFWYRDYNDLDFVRDAAFLENRFFNCKVYDYRVYASKDSYFVVRESVYRGFPALLLCDFRYTPSDAKSVYRMIMAINKLAVKCGFGILFFVCGDKSIEKYYRVRPHYKTSLSFVASRSYRLSDNPSFSLTGGDSDAEFLK